MPGFQGWYKVKQDEMKSDELMRFVHDSRIEDFHQGKHQLQFETYVAYLSTSRAGPPPVPGAALSIGAEGPFWVADQGTPRERRVPVKRGGTFSTSVSIADPPGTHRGQPLAQIDPCSLCRVALEYLEGLVHEVRTILGSTAGDAR